MLNINVGIMLIPVMNLYLPTSQVLLVYVYFMVNIFTLTNKEIGLANSAFVLSEIKSVCHSNYLLIPLSPICLSSQ